MIVVVEGIDRVGKTTLVNRLVKAGFVSIKDEFVIDSFIKKFDDYSVGKCESFVKAARELEAKGLNVVIDRLHLTEYAYGHADRNGFVNEQAIWAVDMMLAKMNAILCYVQPADIELSNKLAGKDQSKKYQMFQYAVAMTSMRTLTCDWNSLDRAFENIMYYTYGYDFYFASPFFNPEQVEREERMIAHLRRFGFRVFSPKENCHLDSKASQNSREEVFKANCDAIRKSRAVFAVTDGKDMGTIWEAGFAYGIGTPIIYFAETLGDNQFNLMLAQSGVDVFTSQSEVTFESLTNALRGNERKFRGDIE